MTRQQRIDAIAARLRVSSDLHIARVEDALGMTPRRDSPDAGEAWIDWTGLDALGRREFALQRLADLGQEWDQG